MLKQADKILCMDANMRETTVDLLESLAECQGRFIWNCAQKYKNVKVTIRDYKNKCQDHMIDYINKLLFEQNKNVICAFSEYKMACKLV